MKRFAKRNGIEDPMTLSISVLSEMYKVEKQWTKRVIAEGIFNNDLTLY